MRAPDDLPDDLEGVERDRYSDDDLNEWDSYEVPNDEEDEPCQPD